MIRPATSYIVALCWAQAITEGSFSMAMTVSQCPDSANAMAFPPAPAKMSMTIDLEGVNFFKSAATSLEIVRLRFDMGSERRTLQSAQV